MQVIIESPGVEVDQKLQQLIYNKMGTLVKWYNRIIKCRVVLRKEKNDRHKDFNISARLEVVGKSMFAREQAESFEIALQRIADDMKHQLSGIGKGREEIW